MSIGKAPKKLRLIKGEGSGTDGEYWSELEDKCDAAICELMFAQASEGASTLEVLLGMLVDKNVPKPAKKRAKRLLELGSEVQNMTQDELQELSGELVEFLRFVCHRGRED